MIHAIIEGAILGITLSLFFGFGPAMVAEIQTGILRGFWAGVFLALGVFLSDAVMVFLGFFGAVQIFESNKTLLGLIGGREVRIKFERDDEDSKKSEPYFTTYIL